MQTTSPTLPKTFNFFQGLHYSVNTIHQHIPKHLLHVSSHKQQFKPNNIPQHTYFISCNTNNYSKQHQPQPKTHHPYPACCFALVLFSGYIESQNVAFSLQPHVRAAGTTARPFSFAKEIHTKTFALFQMHTATIQLCFLLYLFQSSFTKSLCSFFQTLFQMFGASFLLAAS